MYRFRCVTCVCFRPVFPRPEFRRREDVQLLSAALRMRATAATHSSYTQPAQLMTFFSVNPVSRFELTALYPIYFSDHILGCNKNKKERKKKKSSYLTWTTTNKYNNQIKMSFFVIPAEAC